MVTLILLSNASRRALEQPSRMVPRMSSRRLRIFLHGSTISGMREWPAQLIHRLSSPPLGLAGGPVQERAQEFLELPGAVELALGIHAGERGEGRGLVLGQVAGVSEHGVFQALHRLRGRLVLRSPGLVPQPFPDPVQAVGHPGDDVE